MTNSNLFFQIFNLSHKWEILDNLMIFGAESLIFLTFVLVFLLGLRGKGAEKKSLLLIILGIVLAEIIMKLSKTFYYLPRPFIAEGIKPLIQHAADSTFPSGHTTIMSVIAFSYYFYKSKWASLFFLAMLWVGLARIFVGVHYPLDILGGLVLGLLSVKLAWIVKNQLRKKFN